MNPIRQLLVTPKIKGSLLQPWGQLATLVTFMVRKLYGSVGLGDSGKGGGWKDFRYQRTRTPNGRCFHTSHRICTHEMSTTIAEVNLHYKTNCHVNIHREALQPLDEEL